MKKLLTACAFLLLIHGFSYGQRELKLEKDWKVMNGCGISLQVPREFQLHSHSLDDSCRREYRYGGVAIRVVIDPFGIGQEGVDAYSDWTDYCVTKTNIDNHAGSIVTTFLQVTSEDFEGMNYLAMLVVPHFLKRGGNLVIDSWSKTAKGRELAIRVLKSVQVYGDGDW